MITSVQIKHAGFISLLLLTLQAGAQGPISVDIAGIRCMNKSVNGLNTSGFYHFNKHLLLGIEVNRFFPVTKSTPKDEQKTSAWDIDLNMHYLLGVYKGFKFYPITGVDLAVEKEVSLRSEKSHRETFLSLNTGAGILWELKKWCPHIEYSFAWGKHDQQFLLAGISYEISRSSKHHK